MRKRRQLLDGLGDDIRDHIDRETQDNIERGMDPDEARRAARRRFGSIALATEETRAVWTPVWIDQLRQDARYGLRIMRRNPVFATVAIVTLAMGIGMTAAVFSVFNAVLLRPLGYPQADRLVWLSFHDGAMPAGMEMVASPDFLDWQEQATSFDALVAYSSADETVTVAEEAVRARVAAVSDGFWPLTGATPAAGRFPLPAERNAVVLSHELFERSFHEDLTLIGKVASVNGRPMTIVGVLPRGFRFQLPSMTMPGGLPKRVEVYRSLVVPPRTSQFAQLFFVVARLKANISLDRARAELETLRSAAVRANPGPFNQAELRVLPLDERLVGDARMALWVLLVAVALVLLIACANVASLMIARAATRRKEVAIRTAMGAGRARVMRQSLVETLGLALPGCAAGLLAARWAIAAIVRVSPDAVPRLAESSIDARVIAVSVGTTLMIALVFGLGSVVSLSTANVHDLLNDGMRISSAPFRGLRLRSMVMAMEVALAVVLLAGAGLMVKSFWRMSSYPPGFDPERVLMLRVDVPGPDFRAAPDEVARQRARQRAWADGLLARLRPLPGVEAASVHTHGESFLASVTVEGAPPVPHDMRRPPVLLNATSAGFASVMGLRVVTGRWLTDAESMPIVVLNETLARGVFGGSDPLGRRIQMSPDSVASVVGVVSDLKYSKLDQRPQAELYVPYAQAAGMPGLTVVVRTIGNPLAVAPAIRRAVLDTDKTHPPYEVMTLDAALAESILPRRFNLFLLVIFAATALALALIGIYGVTAYSVVQRTYEIGVRMSLGASRSAVVRLIVGHALRVTVVGLAMGLAAAVALTRLMTSVLYEVEPTDPATFAAVVTLLAVAAVAACAGPALKATFVDPVIALRCD